MRTPVSLSSLALLVACGQGPAPASAPVPADQVVVLFSIDGFRAVDLDRPEARHLQAIAAAGVRARALEPVFPSKTFPAHYTIVTGLHAEHHGIVGNTMEDPALGRFTLSNRDAVGESRWWEGEPVWVTAESQGVKAASFFWPGSEAPVKGRQPSWWYRYEESISHADRVTKVLEWLAMPPGQGPRFITLYVSEVDTRSHQHGPDSPEAAAAIVRADSAVGAVWAGIQRLGLQDRVNLMVVSDHGMAPTSQERVILLDEILEAGTYRVVDWNPVAMIAPSEGREQEVLARLRQVPHLQAWRRDDVPERFHFRAHPRITPIVAAADEGWTITSRPFLARVSAGTHGYDNRAPSMQALFVGAGPAFPAGRTVERVRAVDLYSLMAHILRLTPAPNDGSLDSLRAVLR